MTDLTETSLHSGILELYTGLPLYLISPVFTRSTVEVTESLK